MAVSSGLLVILGPTASGKSELAMELARRVGTAHPAPSRVGTAHHPADPGRVGTAHHPGEILSIDSMQVYRGMDIGTAKPTPAERAQVKHHLIDLVDPDQPFTVARFVEMADGVIADAAGRSVPLIATGGTPLYYKALFEGLFDGPAADPAVRERLRSLPSEELHQRLAAVDPPAAQRIHVNDTKRLVRALEVYELTGRPISSFQTDWDATTRHRATWIGLLWDREALNRRINARVKAMMAGGWLDETRELIRRFPELSQTAREATGYAELIEHLNGRISLEDAVEQIKIATRQLARRQMKWFKRFRQVRWLAGEMALQEKVRAVYSARS